MGQNDEVEGGGRCAVAERHGVTPDQAAVESDARIERMDQVAILYGEITAATRAFLSAVAESDRHQDWADEGFGSCAEWLAWQIGVSRNARAGSAANLERLVRGWKRLSRGDEQQQERVRHASRHFSVIPDNNGMYIVRGTLTPEVGAMLMRAIEAGSDLLFGRGGLAEPGGSDSATHRLERVAPPEPEVQPRQRRADAIGLVAERALAAGFGVGDNVRVSGSRAERYQVVLHVETATVTEDQEPGQSELEDGTRVSAETARRLACDSSRVEIRHRPDGPILQLGRRSRSVSPALRRALDSRDRGCRFPGCGLRFTDAHHIKHWGDGGETTLTNLVLLCRRHHRRVHEDGYRVYSDVKGQIVFFTPTGKAFAEVPAPPTPRRRLEADGRAGRKVSAGPGTGPGPDPDHHYNPVDHLFQRNRNRGVTPDGHGTVPRFKRDQDIPWSVEAAAWEALERGVFDGAA